MPSTIWFPRKHILQCVETRDALLGTIDTWLIWGMIGGLNGGVPVTNVSNAYGTMLMNLKTLD